jgi:hypothetical protein
MVVVVVVVVVVAMATDVRDISRRVNRGAVGIMTFGDASAIKKSL